MASAGLGNLTATRGYGGGIRILQRARQAHLALGEQLLAEARPARAAVLV